MIDGAPAVRAITWEQVKAICSKLNSLNPYKRDVVGEILKIEDCNYNEAGEQQQLFGLAVSAKRYVYKRQGSTLQIVKPSEHGLGIVYVPDKRKRYRPVNCKDKETSYPRWIVEAWEHLLRDHFRDIRNPQDSSVSGELWFGNLPAMMRVRVTTPNVLRALRKRDPGAAKPYNFALSPILVEPVPNCTLVAPFSKHPEEWGARDYTETHSGKTVRLGGEYTGKKLVPQTLSTVLWRHYLHPEDKSLAPDGTPCGPYTRGLLLRRPIRAMIPFNFIGKEIERRAQEGEDISLLETSGPRKYQQGQTVKTRAADPRLILRARRFGFRELMREADKSQGVVNRFLNGDRVHPSTRAKLAEAIERLERSARPTKRRHALTAM